jgi:hypothetical protein
VPLRDHRRGRSKRASPAIDRTHWATVAVILLFIGLFAGGAYLYFKGQALSVVTDPITLCPVERQPTQVTVILLDVSDGFAEPQSLQLANYLTRVRDSVPRFGLVELYTLDAASGSIAKPGFHMCNPGDGTDMNVLYQNPGLARKAWRSFSDSISQQLARRIAGAPSDQSPIFEAVQAAALRTFGKPEYDNAPKRLIVVSDLLQNVPDRLSMYAGLPSFQSFRDSPYFTSVRADLTDVSVTIYYLSRTPAYVQGGRHVDFWEAYFHAQGAIVESVTKVFGDQ